MTITRSISTDLVPAAKKWKDNGHLVRDVARLHLDKRMRTLDPTYGLGIWWKQWRPVELVASDKNPEKSPLGRAVDFTAPPEEWKGLFDLIAFDPPYKLNGTSNPDDEKYGVDDEMSWEERHSLIWRGIDALVPCLRKGGIFLFKHQAQVAFHEVRWQTYEFKLATEFAGLKLVDEFYLLGNPTGRAQKTKVQRHARGRPSVLQVLQAA